ELYELGRDSPSSFSAGPIDDDLFHWRQLWVSDTSYSGGIFYLDICLTSDYPLKLLKYTFSCIFTTRIYHLNVTDNGSIDVDFLRPAITISKQ
ncbi:ubiquitin-conjugating enzyme/RWD-like protein, partial [Rhizophagus diaphanus]